MIEIENVEVVGWGAALRGMRMPKLSHHLSDSGYCEDMSCETCPYGADNDTGYCLAISEYIIGPNDLKLAKQLAAGGPVHAKYRRMITVYADITAPAFLWKEISTYKVGTVANSTSTMHKIHSRDLTLEDFSMEDIDGEDLDIFVKLIDRINANRKIFLATGDKTAWYRMIRMLPMNYHYTRTWMANYEVLANIYHSRRDHKLDEWREFCKWIESLPYSELITGGKD